LNAESAYHAARTKATEQRASEILMKQSESTASILQIDNERL
jgi:hypothetical protein